jgi:polysaccharide export outer membrane protein
MSYVLLFLFALGALGTSLTPLLAQSQDAAGDALSLQPGDSVRIVVWQQPQFSGGYAVESDGSIGHPLYRAVKVAGVPFAAAEARLQEFLQRFTPNPQFVFEPLLRVTIGGEVRDPKPLALRPGTTVSQAVSQAGGLTEFARRDRVRVRRGASEFLVDLTRPGPQYAQMPIHSGDELLIERRPAFFRNVFLPTATLLGTAAALVTAITRK